jgi:tetratricopeptide (TPR) repeat protein
MTDLNAEYLRYRNFFTSAAAALQAGNFAVASEQFAQALLMARQYSPRTADEASCLQGLAEAYFGQYKFSDSKATYQQLEQLLDSWGETVTERRFSISLQLARCHEKMHEFDQACAIYSNALEVAEVALRYGDQKMTNVLESYANTLRFARKDPQRLAEIEQKARLSLSRHNNPQFLSQIIAKESEKGTKTAQNRDGAPGVKNRKSPTAVAAASEAGAGQNNFEALQEFAGAHPKIVMGCVCALLFGLLQVLSLLSAINDIKGMNALPPSSPAAAGRIYNSANGKESITFLEHGKVQINGAAGQKDVPFYVASPGWTELIALLLQKPNQVWLVPNAEGLKDYKDNKQLYDLQVCPIIDLQARLSAVARACQLYTLQFQKYPDTNNIIGMVPDVAIPLSDKKQYMPVFISGDKETMAKDIHKFIDNRKIELIHDKKPARKIVCLTMPLSQKMIIAPTDSTGFPFKSELGLQLAIALSDGELLLSDGLSTKVVFFAHLPDTMVISASPPDFIQKLYVNLLINTVVVIVLAVAGIKLKSLTDPTSRNPLPHKLKVLLWLVWSIVAMFMLYRLEDTGTAFLFRG